MASYTKKGVLLGNLGLDTSLPAEYIDDRSSPSGQNMYVNRNAMHKRFGTTALGRTLGEEVMCLKEFLVDSTRYFLRVGLKKVEQYSIANATDSFVVSAANNKLDVTLDGGITEVTATIPSGTYTMGESEADSGSLCEAIYDALVSLEADTEYHVTHDGQYMTISRPAGAFMILWKTGTHGSDNTDTHIGTLLGYDDSANGSGATLTASNAVYCPWVDIGYSDDSFTVDATNNMIDFNIGADELHATVASGTYTMGTNQTTAGSLCKAVYDALHAAEAVGTYTVTFNGSKVIITRSAGTFELLWKTGVNGSDNLDTHIGTLLGYDDSADDTAALSYTADNIVYYPLTGASSDIFSTATPLLSGARTLVISNFKDNIRKYTGTGNCVDLGGTPPKAKFLQEFGAYLVLAHVDTGTKFRSRVQWSDTGNIETWTGGNSGSVDLIEDGNDITGLNLWGGNVCVHKETAIYLGYLVQDDRVFSFERKSTGVGTICNATIQNISESIQLFLARDGIRSFNGSSCELVTPTISDEIREGLNSGYMHKCWSILVPELNEYWVGIPMGSRTAADTVYKFNYVTGQCYKDIYDNASAAGLYQENTQTTIDNLTGTIDGLSFRFDDVFLSTVFPSVVIGTNAGVTVKRNGLTNDDNGVAVYAYRETKDFEGDGKGNLARWLEMQFWAKGNTVQLDYSTDSGVTWTNAGTFTLTSTYPSDDSPLFAYFDTVSSKIRFRFSNNVLGETFSLKDFVIGYKMREARR